MTPINIGPLLDEYYLCDCPKCIQGAHHNPLRVKEYRERGKRIAELEAEVKELNRLMVSWKQRATMSEMDLEATKAEVERLTSSLKSYWHSATWRAEIGRNAQATAFTKD